MKIKPRKKIISETVSEKDSAHEDEAFEFDWRVPVDERFAEFKEETLNY